MLYDDRYQPAPRGGGEEAPTFAAAEGYGQFIYVYRTGVRARVWRQPAGGQQGVLPTCCFGRCRPGGGLCEQAPRSATSAAADGG